MVTTQRKVLEILKDDHQTQMCKEALEMPPKRVKCSWVGARKGCQLLGVWNSCNPVVLELQIGQMKQHSLLLEECYSWPFSWHGEGDVVKRTAALTTRMYSVFLEHPKVTGGLQLLSKASALLRRGETRGDSSKLLCFSSSCAPLPHCYFCLKVLRWQWHLWDWAKVRDTFSLKLVDGTYVLTVISMLLCEDIGSEVIFHYKLALQYPASQTHRKGKQMNCMEPEAPM